MEKAKGVELKGLIFDIQKFSVHDGPGIRTLIFLKGCGLRCLWCSNPESQLKRPELMLYPEKCIGCHKCMEVCPTGAVFSRNGKIYFSKELCKACGKCAEVCPAEARRLVGNYLTVDEVLKEIDKDRMFYRTSGGGVTFGGGEPLLYPDFVVELSKACREKYINTSVETCGYVPWEHIEKAAPYLDLIMFDLKHMDSKAHKKLCGRSNRLILSNLKKLSKLHSSEIIVRMPVIPTVNDSGENLKKTAEFVASLGNAVSRIEIMPYHTFGVKKYERLGRTYQLKEKEVPSDEHMKSVKGILEAHKVPVKIV